ncbi:formin-like protein 5 isoform X1 [Iris pallida]|uniref:Formin-like protein 5 isoform X1 n=1 Tax=Iris pallida TaxID=29817 RepID=A0AAX6IGW1_IRIPA|nr:formin-like protein 5 isoform X1 [Iris pallida]
MPHHTEQTSTTMTQTSRSQHKFCAQVSLSTTEILVSAVSGPVRPCPTHLIPQSYKIQTNTKYKINPYIDPA